MFGSYFTPTQQGVLAVAVLLGATALVLQARTKQRAAIITLTLAALVLRLFAAWLDPFLNDWDEVYHAVVARNLMTHPFTPMLYTEVAMPADISWSAQHYWLHKPPFFLWQIALSLKIFGLHPWAVRLPSVFWLTALVPVVWRIGCLVRNAQTGFAAAFLVAFAYLPQELTSGALNTDHNDAIFIAVVACSWWAWLELLRAPSWKWSVVIGLCAAGAVLTKWYIGGCVFLPWGLWVLHGRFRWERLKWMLLALVVTAGPVLAWLGYIAHRFPVEAAFERHDNWLRWTTGFEGHGGPWWFHFDVIQELIPPLSWWLLLPASAWLIWRVEHAAHRIFLVSLLAGIHLFFIIAQTKMVCYAMVLFPLYFLATAEVLASLAGWLPWERARRPLLAVLVGCLAFFTLRIERTQALHTLQEYTSVDTRWRRQNLAASAELEKLFQLVASAEKPVLFNLPRNQQMRFMFAYGIDAWAGPPLAQDVERLNAAGCTVFVLQDGSEAWVFPPGAILVPDSVVSISRDVRIDPI